MSYLDSSVSWMFVVTSVLLVEPPSDMQDVLMIKQNIVNRCVLLTKDGSSFLRWPLSECSRACKLNETFCWLRTGKRMLKQRTNWRERKFTPRIDRILYVIPLKTSYPFLRSHWFGLSTWVKFAWQDCLGTAQYLPAKGGGGSWKIRGGHRRKWQQKFIT